MSVAPKYEDILRYIIAGTIVIFCMFMVKWTYNAYLYNQMFPFAIGIAYCTVMMILAFIIFQIEWRNRNK